MDSGCESRLKPQRDSSLRGRVGAAQGGVGINKRHLGSIFFFQRREADLPTT